MTIAVVECQVLGLNALADENLSILIDISHQCASTGLSANHRAS
jgi:hypothetical protein